MKLLSYLFFWSIIIFACAIRSSEAQANKEEHDNPKCKGPWSVHAWRTSDVYCRVHHDFILEKQGKRWIFYSSSKKYSNGEPDPRFRADHQKGTDPDRRNFARDACDLDSLVITRTYCDEETGKCNVSKAKLRYAGKDVDKEQKGTWHSLTRIGCLGEFWFRRGLD